MGIEDQIGWDKKAPVFEEMDRYYSELQRVLAGAQTENRYVHLENFSLVLCADGNWRGLLHGFGDKFSSGLTDPKGVSIGANINMAATKSLICDIIRLERASSFDGLIAYPWDDETFNAFQMIYDRAEIVDEGNALDSVAMRRINMMFVFLCVSLGAGGHDAAANMDDGGAYAELDSRDAIANELLYQAMVITSTFRRIMDMLLIRCLESVIREGAEGLSGEEINLCHRLRTLLYATHVGIRVVGKIETKADEQGIIDAYRMAFSDAVTVVGGIDGCLLGAGFTPRYIVKREGG